MIYATPGDTFITVAEGFNAGLVGTIGVRIENTDGSNHTPRTTAGIVELEPGAGAYSKTDLTAPTAGGTYIVIWDTGGGSPLYATEELRVTHTAATPGPPIVTLDELKQYANVTRDDNDAMLLRMLNAALGVARSKTGRQLDKLPSGSGDHTVTKRVAGSAQFLRIPDAREIATVTIDDEEITPEVEHRQDGVIVAIELPTHSGTSCDVVGKFGFDPLPDDLREAILEEAAARYYDRSTGNADSAASEEYGGGSFSRPPGWARMIFKTYKVVTQG